MTLLHPLWLLPAALLVFLFLILKSTRSDAWTQVIDARVLNFLSYGEQYKAHRHLSLLLAAIACIALSSPSIPGAASDTFKHSEGWIILTDVSRSMSLNDVAPSRLSAMRDAAHALVDRAGANSSSLIIYSGDAFVIAPPSFDTHHIKENINLLDYGTVPIDGSNLTRALSLAWSVIESSQLINARLFILSDSGGFNTRSDAAISRLAKLGHRTDILLFGTEASNTVAPLDIRTATSMAQSGNGQLLHADAVGNINLASLKLEGLNTSAQFLTQAGITTLRWSNQSHWILLLALPLLLWAFYRELQ